MTKEEFLESGPGFKVLFFQFGISNGSTGVGNKNSLYEMVWSDKSTAFAHATNCVLAFVFDL
jgi:hypothetical protein